MSNGNIDKRASDALNFFYGNKTGLGSMRTKWVTYGVYHSYLFGHATDVLFTALGYQDICNNVELGPLPYPLEVAIQSLSPIQLASKNWGGVLDNWMGINAVDSLKQSFNQDDAVIIVDVTSSSSQQVVDRTLQLMNNAVQAKTTLFLITRPGSKLPAALFQNGMRFTGSENAQWLPFMATHLDAFMANHVPQRFFVYGEGLRVVSTALSALDHLNRHQGGKRFADQHATQVFVDVQNAVLASPVSSYESVLDSFGIPYTHQVPTNVKLGPQRDAALIQPVY
jgi:hypothetical protein